MRYIMRQKMFTLADSFQIKNENGEDAFVVSGKVFSVGKQLAFEDLEGNTLIAIKQKLFSWGPTYELWDNENAVAVVKKELFNVFSFRFSIDLSGSDPLQATGDFLNHEYVIYRDEQPIATISKQWFTLANTYGVEINDAEEDVLMLAITVVIEMICHPDHQ